MASNHSHSHAHGSPSHTHSDAGHGHTYAVASSPQVQTYTQPDNMRVIVDGVDITSQIGGPFNGIHFELDITPFVAPGTGAHVVQITTANNLGKLQAWVRQKGIGNNLSATS